MHVVSMDDVPKIPRKSPPLTSEEVTVQQLAWCCKKFCGWNISG